jgi:hypothetical protein
LDRLKTKVVAMLAEILIVRLEAIARLSRETTPASNSRFVPFTPGQQFAFKDRGNDPAVQSPEPEQQTASSHPI